MKTQSLVRSTKGRNLWQRFPDIQRHLSHWNHHNRHTGTVRNSLPWHLHPLSIYLVRFYDSRTVGAFSWGPGRLGRYNEIGGRKGVVWGSVWILVRNGERGTKDDQITPVQILLASNDGGYGGQLPWQITVWMVSPVTASAVFSK